MYNCKDFDSLSVLSLYEGELIGRVSKLYFDKKLKKLVEIELVGENDLKLRLATKNIYHIGKNAITVKNNLAVELKVDETDYITLPISCKAYSLKGEYLGSVQDIQLSDKFLVEKFILNNSNIEANRLATCGKNTIIFYDSNEQIKISKFNPKPAPKMFKQTIVKASILPVEKEPKTEPNLEQATADVQPQTAVEIKKTKPAIRAEFLVGRICLKDIYNFNNEVLIKSHSIINKKNLKEVDKYGKLRELMLFSK